MPVVAATGGATMTGVITVGMMIIPALIGAGTMGIGTVTKSTAVKPATRGIGSRGNGAGVTVKLNQLATLKGGFSDGSKEKSRVRCQFSGPK